LEASLGILVAIGDAWPPILNQSQPTETVTRHGCGVSPADGQRAAIRCVTPRKVLGIGPVSRGQRPPLARIVSERQHDCGAFVIACFSDPGIHSLRELARKPVLGIAECSILTALTIGQKFGVIAILQQSIARHARYIAALGVRDRLAGELPVGLGVTELVDAGKTYERMVETGKKLRDDHGADVVVMGCAGMAPYRKPLQAALGIPVVEPTQAAVAMAIGRVRLGWHLL
jgi:Asp/Glu/hydantoin racemase